MSDTPKLRAKWTPDCSGKQDYDGEILSISTRYWPRGGGYFTFNSAQGGFHGNETRPEIKPSAHSSLILRRLDDESLTFAEAKFEAETEAEVKARVETWAQAQMERAVRALSAEFREPRERE